MLNFRQSSLQQNSYSSLQVLIDLSILTATFLVIFLAFGVYGKPCPGICTITESACTSNGGSIIGHCKNSKPCCTYKAKLGNTNSKHKKYESDKFKNIVCGDTYKVKPNEGHVPILSFKSSNYPEPSSGDLNCEVKIELGRDKSIDGVKIDFVEFEMDEMKYGMHPRVCDSDRLFIKGFNSWTPPERCGNMTGYSTVIDKKDPRASNLTTLTLLTVMSSLHYKWNIEIFILKNKVGKSLGNPAREIKYLNKGGHFDPPKTRSITNGNNTLIAQLPWQVSIRLSYSFWEKKFGSDYMKEHIKNSSSIHETRCGYLKHFCGGSIIAPQYILTAAHCFFGDSKKSLSRVPSDVVIVVGESQICGKAEQTNNTYEVEQIIYHYGYELSFPDNDVVLLKLAREIEFHSDDNIKIIELAKPDSNYTGHTAIGSGWGKTNLTHEKLPPNTLQSNNNFVILHQSKCEELFEILLGEELELAEEHVKYSQMSASTICTHGHGNSELNGGSQNNIEKIATAMVGEGDSGGPLVLYKNDSTPIQIGVISYRLRTFDKSNPNLSDQNITDFFQSVSFFHNWISIAININHV